MSIAARVAVITFVTGLMLGTAPGASAQGVIPPIEPPKPAVPRSPNAIVVGTADLNASVNWARQGMLDEAVTAYELFKEDWVFVSDEVRQQSQDIADRVDAAAGQVQAALEDNEEPDQTVYFPLLQNLQQVVEDANSELSVIAPASSVRINPVNLAQSVNWATKDNLAKTHDEFRQFLDDWAFAEKAVRARLPLAAANIDAAITQVRGVIDNTERLSPPRSEYLPVLQNLQQAVADANRQLAALPPLSADEQTAVPIKISPGNLGEAVDFASQGNLSAARSEFRQFQGDWSAVQRAVRDRSAPIADQVEATIAATQVTISAADPPKDLYLGALLRLQSVVEDANVRLAR